jgi:hypothetical protein
MPKTEAEAAKQWNESIQSRLRNERLTSGLLAGLLLAAGLVAAWFCLEMTSFCLVVLSLIIGLKCYDSHSELQYSRRWPRKHLFPRISLLQRDAGASATKPGEPLT